MAEIQVKVLTGFWPRLRGLLGTRIGDPELMPILMERCKSIHTFGMRYSLDVAFINERGYVVRSQRKVVPGRHLRSRVAKSVLERPAAQEPWPLAGQRLSMGKTYQDKQGREYKHVEF